MEKSTPIRKPYTSTADLLTWSENQPEISPAVGSAARSHQPSDAISKVLFGGQVTDEEVENLNKRKPCSSYKLKEITGSGIFVESGENGTLESESADSNLNNKSGLRKYQQAVAGMSQISFGEEANATPKKPTTVPEVAKQRELSGTLETESEAKLKKQISDAKNKELSGHNIFAPPPEIKPRPLSARVLALKESITIGESAPPSNEISGNGDGTAIKTAKKIPEKKFAELSGTDIFKGDGGGGGGGGGGAQMSAEKPLSSAKLREMNGSNIFADGKVESRDYFGGVRKPPGGESSIALV